MQMQTIDEITCPHALAIRILILMRHQLAKQIAMGICQNMLLMQALITTMLNGCSFEDTRGIINRPGSSDNVFPRKTYWLADISANYRVRENVTIFGRINNTF